MPAVGAAEAFLVGCLALRMDNKLRALFHLSALVKGLVRISAA